MFPGLSCHFELIFGLMTCPKYYLSEVEKAMFQVVACKYEIIFFLLTSPKCDLCDDDD